MAQTNGVIMEFVWLIIGLAIIIKSADILVDASSKIARKYGVSTFVIGITVIAFGTSAPELVVGLVSAVNKTNQLTLGNIIGSVYVNATFIVGIAAMIFPLAVKDTVIKRELPMLIFVQAVLAFMILADGELTRFEGVVLLLGFVGFVIYIALNIKKLSGHSLDIGEERVASDARVSTLEAGRAQKTGMVKTWILSALSLVGLFIGGKLAVDNSSQIATNFGLSETIIGLTVVTLATTLPEFITSIMAARKKEHDIVLGNCIGSTLFNILFVLGLSSVVNPIKIQDSMTIDMLLMIALTALIFMVSLFKKRISRLFGFVLAATYLSYLCYKVVMALT